MQISANRPQSKFRHEREEGMGGEEKEEAEMH